MHKFKGTRNIWLHTSN